jgi:hypothetical protein
LCLENGDDVVQDVGIVVDHKNIRLLTHSSALLAIPLRRSPQRIGPHLPYLFSDLGSRPGKLATHGRRNINHLNAPALQANFL